MKTDQFDDTADDVVLARCVSMLVAALYDEEGYPIDIADKKGREELIRVIEALPKEIHTRLSESDRKLLNEYMETLDKLQKELKKTQKAIRFYMRWGCVVVPMGTHNITYKRNRQTIITVNVEDASQENALSLSLEDEEMGQGNTYTVTGSQITDTTVKPETEGR